MKVNEDLRMNENLRENNSFFKKDIRGCRGEMCRSECALHKFWRMLMTKDEDCKRWKVIKKLIGDSG